MILFKKCLATTDHAFKWSKVFLIYKQCNPILANLYLNQR